MLIELKNSFNDNGSFIPKDNRNQDYQNILERIAAGEEYQIYDEKKELLESAKAQKKAQCLAFLNANDWQAVRSIETGEPISQDLLNKKALARSLQDDIKACKTLEELEKINVNFE